MNFREELEVVSKSSKLLMRNKSALTVAKYKLVVRKFLTTIALTGSTEASMSDITENFRHEVGQSACGKTLDALLRQDQLTISTFCTDVRVSWDA